MDMKMEEVLMSFGTILLSIKLLIDLDYLFF
jgi:hypothetical protein